MDEEEVEEKERKERLYDKHKTRLYNIPQVFSLSMDRLFFVYVKYHKLTGLCRSKVEKKQTTVKSHRSPVILRARGRGYEGEEVGEVT